MNAQRRRWSKMIPNAWSPCTTTCAAKLRTPSLRTVTSCPLPRLKRTGHPPDRKIRDFAEIISAFLATPSPLIRQNLRFRRNFVKHFLIPWNSDKFSSKSARKHVKLIQNLQKMMKFGGKIAKIKTKNWQIFECGAVQRNENLVDLEKCEKMRLLSLS